MSAEVALQLVRVLTCPLGEFVPMRVSVLFSADASINVFHSVVIDTQLAA